MIIDISDKSVLSVLSLLSVLSVLSAAKRNYCQIVHLVFFAFIKSDGGVESDSFLI